MRLFFLIPQVSVLLSCANVEAPGKCAAVDTASIFPANHYILYLYGANDESNPDIWDGPVCIERQGVRKVCELDVSLIKAVDIGAADELNLGIFSGSVEQVLNVDVKECSVK